jgi:hypothetical protein
MRRYSTANWSILTSTLPGTHRRFLHGVHVFVTFALGHFNLLRTYPKVTVKSAEHSGCSSLRFGGTPRCRYHRRLITINDYHPAAHRLAWIATPVSLTRLRHNGSLTAYFSAIRATGQPRLVSVRAPSRGTSNAPASQSASSSSREFQ